MLNFRDGHSSLVTPVLIPNTEVKLATSFALVSDKTRNCDAVLLIFIKSFSFNYL